MFPLFHFIFMPTDEQQYQPQRGASRGVRENRLKKAPSQKKGVGAFSFWDGFEVGI